MRACRRQRQHTRGHSEHQRFQHGLVSSHIRSVTIASLARTILLQLELVFLTCRIESEFLSHRKNELQRGAPVASNLNTDSAGELK